MKKKRMILFSLIVIIMFLFIFIIIPFVSSDIYISPTDGTRINDTYIAEKTAASGNSTNILVGNVSSGYSRGLIMFNISGLPNLLPTYTIYDAKIQLNVTTNSGGTKTIKLYRMTNNWIESQANWTNRDSNTNWNINGAEGDYDNLVILNWTKISNTGFYNFSIPGYIIKGWLNGTYDNYGIILISNDSTGINFTIFASSDNANPLQRPIIIINYTTNAAPSIQNITTDSDGLYRTQAGDSVNFQVNWTDIESDQAQIFICNSSGIDYLTGCQQKTFCNTSFESPGISSCSYTTLDSDNTTTAFYVGVCDEGSHNCTNSSKQNFYVNHAPKVIIIRPNGGDTINQSQGNYLVKFNVSDKDKDFSTLTAELSYGEKKYSTDNLIVSIDDLSSYCTYNGNGITENCTYPWNTTGIWGTYFLTINLSDYRSSSINSSNSSFDVRSIIDTTPPNLTGMWINSNDIYSGKTVQFFANATDDISMGRVWVNITNTDTSEIIESLTMNLLSGKTYYVNWTAVAIGNYSYNVYARDKVGNLNDSMPWSLITIRAPNATAQNELYPSTALPFSLIRISGELNSTDSLRGVHATLNVPAGFTFLNDYPQNESLGDFDSNETKTATWMVSVPYSQATYTLNITYSDEYRNSWQSNNFNVQVTQALGGGGDYFAISGYPEVEADESYYVEAYFLSSGIFTNVSSAKISIYNPSGVTIISSDNMNNKTTGIYNYTYTAPSNQQLSGIWTTIINATKSGITYQAKQFWRMLTYSFDVKNIQVLDPHSNNLSFSAYIENKGDAGTDVRITWNLTNSSGGQIPLGSGLAQPKIEAGQNMTYYFSLQPVSYLGPARITVTVYYPQSSFSEKAMSYKEFTIISPGAQYCGDGSCNNGETCSSCPNDCGQCQQPPGGGGGVGGGAAAPLKQKKSINITKFEPIVYLSQNMNKKVMLEIKNTGTQTLTGITLTLENLNKDFYNINPLIIDSLNPGETKSFEINFLVKDFIGEENFNYIVSSENVEAKETGKIIVLTIKDYFTREIDSLEKRIKDIKTETTDKNILDSLTNCEKILNESKSSFEKEEYISLDDSLKRADNCITIIENKLKEKPIISMNYTTWIIISIIFLILLLLIAFGIYYTYKKTRALSVFSSRISSKEGIKSPEKEKTLDEKYFDDKMKNIQDKLKD